MPRSTKKLYRWLWSSLPCALTLVLLVIYLTPKHISGLGNVMPLLPLMPVFFWGVAYPAMMPYWFVFLLGLLVDTVSGLPLGLSSLLYVFFLVLLHAQRKYIHKEGFVIKWGYFSALLAVVLLANWLALLVLYSQTISLQPAIVQWLLSVCLYPLFHMGFGVLADYIAQRRWKLERISYNG